MRLWKWLNTPDHDPGFTSNKLLKLFIKVTIFALIATLVSSLLMATPLRPYLQTWWGSMLLVLLLYIPMYKFLSVDTFTPRRFQEAPPRTSASGKPTMTAAERRKEKHRYAGVKRSPPKFGGRR